MAPNRHNKHFNKLGHPLQVLSTAETPRAPIVLRLEVSLEQEVLKIAAHEQVLGQETTLGHYEYQPLPAPRLKDRCRAMVETLNQCSRNRQRILSRDVLEKLALNGQVLSDEFFPSSVKQRLLHSKAAYLTVHMTGQLVHIPWELFHDGSQFLCQRFAMGRLVRTRQVMPHNSMRSLDTPLKLLIVADPETKLGSAYDEGRLLRDLADRYSADIRATFYSRQVDRSFIREQIRNFDLVHFAGHASYNMDQPSQSGWHLAGSILTAEDISRMAGAGAMPALVFSNACQSARTGPWLGDHFQDEIFGLANAFLLAGVKHYVGTFWEVLDKPSQEFAMEFYNHLSAGAPIGEALRQARLAVVQSEGIDCLIWTSYVLYGDPSTRYMPVAVEPIGSAGLDGAPPEQGKTYSPQFDPAQIRTSVSHTTQRAGRAKYVAVALLLLIIVSVAVSIYDTNYDSKYEQRVETLVKIARENAQFEADRHRQADTDQLIRELTSKFYSKKHSRDRKPKEHASAPSDAWTSRPFGMWVMDFKETGYPLQKDETLLLSSAFVDCLVRDGRIRIIDRKLLNSLLRELKLGTSELVSQETALSLGKMVAARAILLTQILRAETHTNASMSLVDTETGEIVIATRFTAEPDAQSVELGQLMAKSLLKKIRESYPIRGIITKINGNSVEINVGTQAGVNQNTRFKIDGEDTVLGVVTAGARETKAKIIPKVKNPSPVMAMGIRTGIRVQEIVSTDNPVNGQKGGN